MTILPEQTVPDDILANSILAHIAAAYFAVGKQLERKTQCSATRGFILSALRDGAPQNQNRLSKQVGIERTVVHRAVKAMVQEGLLLERPAKSGREIPVQLSAKGKRYRDHLIETRIAADETVRQQLTTKEYETLLRTLQRIAEVEL